MTTEFIEQQSELELAVGLWQPGRYVWKLEDIRQLASPILTKGKQGLWNVSLDLRQKFTEPDQVQLHADSRYRRDVKTINSQQSTQNSVLSMVSKT